MEAICDLFKGVLNLVYSDFVLERLFTPLLNILGAAVQLGLNLTDDIILNRCLPLCQVAHDFLVRAFDHLPEHIHVRLAIFGHLLHVNFDIIL